MTVRVLKTYGGETILRKDNFILHILEFVVPKNNLFGKTLNGCIRNLDKNVILIESGLLISPAIIMLPTKHRYCSPSKFEGKIRNALECYQARAKRGLFTN